MTPFHDLHDYQALPLDRCCERREEVAVIDTRTGTRRTLLSAPDADFSSPRVSPDGQSVLAIRSGHDTVTAPGDVTLVLAPLDGNAGPADLLAVMDRWPAEAVWAADSGSVFFTADDQGRRPVFRAEVRPPARPAVAVTRLTEIATTASDGSVLRAWLVLPAAATAAEPAPLLLWVHGGPLSSWNTWSWRWNPWLMAARSYAVLLPDPVLSTGYGLDFIARGHAEWGSRPFTDLMAVTDAAAARPDIDETRTGMMGGSFGGYMATGSPGTPTGSGPSSATPACGRWTRCSAPPTRRPTGGGCSAPRKATRSATRPTRRTCTRRRSPPRC